MAKSSQSPRLVSFARGVNSGLSTAVAARNAGYAETTVQHQSAQLLRRARTAGLIPVPSDAREPLEAMRAAVTADDWRAIATRAVEDAKDGDPQARTWLRDTLMGRPATKVDATVDQRTSIVFEYSDAVDVVVDEITDAILLPPPDDDDE